MKKLTLIFILLPFFLFAQQEECGFIPSTDLFNLNKFSRTTKSTFDNDVPYIFNVKFHVVNEDNGSLGITEDHILNQIAKLNINFNQFNIFFKYRGFDEINDSNYFTHYIGEYQLLKDHFVELNLYDENAINIFILQSQSYAFRNDCILHFQTVLQDSSTNVIHEMGHALGLVHIFSGSQFSNEQINDDQPCEENLINTPFVVPNLNASAENITRDINDVNYNADTAGDMVTDTDAFYKNAPRNKCYNIITHDYTFPSHPELVDNVGEMYLETYDFDDEFHNFMSYGADLDNFSNGQGVRMREYIENEVSDYIYQKLCLTPDGSPDISVLYEPYKSIYTVTISDDIYSLTDNGDGTAEECRWRDGTYFNYFQPGFDYDFGFMSSDLNHSVSKNYLPYIIDEGQFRVIKINQVDPIFLNVNSFNIDDYDYLTDLSQGIIKYSNAYHNSWASCETVSFLSAKIMSKDNLASPYSQLLELNNQDASNPNLEQNLENNKFHFIEKTTINGNKIQKTIYKNGN